DPASEDHESHPHSQDDQIGVVDEQAGDRAKLHDPAVLDLTEGDQHHEDQQSRRRRHGRRVQSEQPAAGDERADGVGQRGQEPALRLLGRGAHATRSFIRTGPRRSRNSARTRDDWARQITMITTALNAGVAAEGTPRNTTVLSSVVISSAPTTAPPRENFPPLSAVPPITTARMASSSSR